MITSKPTRRYLDIRSARAAIREYVGGAGGTERVLAKRGIAFDAVRMRLLEISEAAAKLGALAEVHEPTISWRRVRSYGNYLRHEYDDIDIDAMLRALSDLDDLDAARARAIERAD